MSEKCSKDQKSEYFQTFKHTENIKTRKKLKMEQKPLTFNPKRGQFIKSLTKRARQRNTHRAEDF